ncbi:MAG: BNR repeat-containing protein [Proteobacteria bacterium]|nr:BNR repeat-containing protein [Pseudomonadota bacterium]
MKQYFVFLCFLSAACSQAVKVERDYHVVSASEPLVEDTGIRYGGLVTQHADLAVDSQGTPHISYKGYSDSNNGLQYAYRTDAGTWAEEAVDTRFSSGRNSSIAVDPSGRIHISYGVPGGRAGLQTDLEYAYRDPGGAWHIEHADASPAIRQGKESSIAVDSQGGVHVSHRAFVDATGETQVRYTYRSTDGQWTPRVVDVAGVTYTAIALGADDSAHIVYSEWGSAEVRYAYQQGDSFAIETVGSGRVTGRSVVAVDESGVVYVSYYDFDSRQLMYAERIGGQWQTRRASSPTGEGQYNAVAVGLAGRMHLAYGSGHDLAVHHGAKSPGADLATQVWDPAGGFDLSLATDSSGAAHALYPASDYPHTLQYAYWPARSLTIEDTGITYGGLVTMHSALAADSNGIPHLSYMHFNDDLGLRYAYRDDRGAWTEESVDPSFSSGRYSAIAADNAGESISATLFPQGRAAFTPISNTRIATRVDRGIWSTPRARRPSGWASTPRSRWIAPAESM